MTDRPSFNLIDEPWIPRIWNGQLKDVGIRDALINAGKYREIFDASPLVTVSLHRILLAIVYRAIPPNAGEDWDMFWPRLWGAKEFPAPLVDKYLDAHHRKFDLFSNECPFFQTAGLSTERPGGISRLVLQRHLIG